MSENPRLRVSIILLVVANLVPVFGVLFLDWDVFYVMLLFWCENVVIGIFGILRLFVSTGNLFVAAFFTVHYGGFMMGHLMVLFALFSNAFEGQASNATDPEHFLAAFLNPPTLIAIAALFVSHGWSYIANFLGSDERNLLTGARAMTQPYRRMIITHIALLAGGFFVTTMGQPLPGLLLLIAMKIGLDVVFHRREHETIAI
ncbi:MAG: DUF6498-containing protein [Pseudomonadota bacterium]